MRVRLGFAVAAFLEPEILIVDEVLAVGDAEFQKRAIGKMQEVSQAQGRTVLFVSHNMGSIKELMQKKSPYGKMAPLLFDGETDACINRYLTKSKEEIGSKLSSIKNRNGNGKLRFADYKFRNEDNEIITEVISGEYLKIEIDFDLHKKVNFQKLIIVLNIQDNFEKSIISYVTDEMGTKFNDPIDNKLIIEIPELLLRGGSIHC